MDSSIECAIQLNNESVVLLCAGEDEKAITTLTKSLALVRQQISGQAGCHWPTEKHPDYCMSTMPAIPARMPLAQLRDANYFIYNQCMTIPNSHQRSARNIPIYSACIVLNLALSYHRLTTRGYSWCAEKAEKMYGMAIRLLSGPLTASNETALSMRMVALNNLAQIHNDQCRFLETKNDIQELSAMINTVVSYGEFFTSCDLHSFVLNIMLWGPPRMAAAA